MSRELSKSGSDHLPIRGPEYLVPYACFSCRKSWKKPEGTTGKCPNCGGQMYSMGRKFRVPKSSDSEQWQKIEKLRLAGYAFYLSVHNYEAEPVPERLRDVDDWIARTRAIACATTGTGHPMIETSVARG